MKPQHHNGMLSTKAGEATGGSHNRLATAHYLVGIASGIVAIAANVMNATRVSTLYMLVLLSFCAAALVLGYILKRRSAVSPIRPRGTTIMSRLWRHFNCAFLGSNVVVLAVGVALLFSRADNIGKPVPATLESFLVDGGGGGTAGGHYSASGLMGDIGDMQIGSPFTYTPRGRGPHEYEWKYVGNTVSRNPAKFAGVVWLSPSNAFGTAADGGYDLRGFRTLRWEACSLSGPVKVKFFIGGINWIWECDQDNTWKRVTPPYPDTMPAIGLGLVTLTERWDTFQADLSKEPGENLKRVVGGFGFTIDWGGNGLEADDSGLAPKESKVLRLEIRNIRYERTKLP